tara:strand:- start:57 stop:410 length:354 start_codon:yes stop_codon:yes gene_type:complete
MTTRKNFTPAIKVYLLTVLADHDHEIENPTDEQLFEYAFNRYVNEYSWNENRLSRLENIKEWLLGLALNVDYTYHDIGLRLKEWGVLTGEESETKQDQELDQYWSRLASVLNKNFKF